MANPTIEFYFDELPLIVENGIEAGNVSGTAVISYWRDGEWAVNELYLSGWKTSAESKVDYRAYLLDEGHPIYLAILHRLEHDKIWSNRIENDINEDAQKRYLADLDARDEARAERMREWE